MTSYVVTVLGDGTAVGQGFTTCGTSTCSYIQQGSLLASNYTVIVTSINGGGSMGSQDNATIYGEIQQ